MSKRSIDEVLAPKPEVRPRIYAYSIDDKALVAIENSLYKYIDVATETALDVGVNVGVSGRILDLLAQQPQLSARDLASLLKKTQRTVERHLKALREQGRIRRVGSDKAGHWEVIARPS